MSQIKEVKITDRKVGDRNYRLAAVTLAYGLEPDLAGRELAELGETLCGPHILLVKGKMTLWASNMLCLAAHSCQAMATFDPARGGFVVCHSHLQDLQIGAVIETNSVGFDPATETLIDGTDATPHRPLVIAVGGPPHSGKSVFLFSLWEELERLAPGMSWVQRGCPDDEGCIVLK